MTFAPTSTFRPLTKRIDAADFVPETHQFRSSGTTVLEAIQDTNLTASDVRFYLLLATTFYRTNKFEGRQTIINLFPEFYSSPIMLSRKFQKLVNNGYLKVERVLQCESVYVIAPLKGMK